MRFFSILFVISLVLPATLHAEEHVFRFQKEIGGVEYSVLQVPRVNALKEKPQLDDVLATYDWFVTKRVRTAPDGTTKNEVIFRGSYELRSASGGHHELHIYDLCFVGKDQLYLCGKMNHQVCVVQLDLAKQKESLVLFRNEASGISNRITLTASIVQHAELLKVTLNFPKEFESLIYDYDLKLNKILNPARSY